MEETFTAGIRPGGLTEGREIRILVCHILSELSEPMSFDEMTEAILSDEVVDFDIYVTEDVNDKEEKI